MSKSFRVMVLALVLIAAVAASSLQLTGAQEPKIMHSAVLPGDLTIDPALARWVQEIQVVSMMYPGLCTFEEKTSSLQPGLALDWQISADSKTVTFHLMKDVPWVRWDKDKNAVVQITDDAGKVRTVTANDLVYGYNRTLDPATGSEYSSVLAPWVVNGSEKLRGEAVQLGIKAVDDYTVEITSPKPAGYLPYIYSLWMARPQPQWAIEQYGDTWTELGNFPSYGPYALHVYDHDVEIAIVKNPYWPGNDAVPQAKIDEHTWVYLDEAAALTSYEAGELDWINFVPPADLDRLRVERPNELTIAPDTCTYFYGFNVLKPPTDNVHLRRALSLAIDRSVIVQITNGGEVPAGFFTRPDVAAAPKQEDYPQYAIKTDVEAAKKELQAYFDETKTTAKDLPPIILMHNTSTRHATIAQAIQQMWKENLGIDVEITTQDSNVFNETLRRDAPQVFRKGWCWDYPDTSSFLDEVFRNVGPDSNNNTNWSNEEYNKLVDQAGVLTDDNARRDLYAQAENILVNQEAAIAPIYFYTIQQLTQSYVERNFAADKVERLYKWDVKK